MASTVSMSALRAAGWRAACVCAGLCGLAGAASAQPVDDEHKPWSVMLGVGLRHGPDYLGSDDQRTRAVPIIRASYRTSAGRFSVGDLPAAPGPFIAYTPYETERWSIGVGVGRDPGRDDDGSDGWTYGSSRLRGMGDLDATPMWGGACGLSPRRLAPAGLAAPGGRSRRRPWWPPRRPAREL